MTCRRQSPRTHPACGQSILPITHRGNFYLKAQFAYSGPASSAEWIVEDPTVTSGTPPVNSQPPLANFGTTPFSNLGASATNDNATGVFPVDMIDASSNVIAYPSALSASGFTVTYVPLSITTSSLTADINTSYSQTLSRKWWCPSVCLVDNQRDTADWAHAQRVVRCGHRNAHGGGQPECHFQSHGCARASRHGDGVDRGSDSGSL